MIRRHVLAALATGVEAGDDDAARAALAHTDWVVRGAARRRLERALLDAALISQAMVSAADAEAMRHVQRVAALSLAGRDDVDATRRDEVTDAYARLPAVHPPAAPVATILASAAAVALLAVLAVAFVALRTPASHRKHRGAVPLPWGAYLTGGAPERDPRLEHLLADELPALVIEADTDRHGSADTGAHANPAAWRELRASPVIAARGPALAAAWQELVDGLDAWVTTPRRTAGFSEAEERLRAAAQAVSDRFAALGLAYHLEAGFATERGAAHGVLFSFRVEDVAFVHTAGEPRRVLSLRRLDRLNISHAVLGMQTEELGDPVVMLDQIDDFVGNRLSPVILGARFWVGDDAFTQSDTGARLAAGAGTAIARELAPFGRDRPAITRLVVATVRRHEARHGYDNDRATPLRYPDALYAVVGEGNGYAAFVARARAELAAYVSQIASDPHTPQLALWNLANLGFDKGHWGSAESYVAVVVVEGLARQLGVKPGPGPVIHDGHIDRNRFANLGVPLAAVSDDDLRAAARRLWQDLYHEPFIAIVDPAPIVATLGP